MMAFGKAVTGAIKLLTNKTRLLIVVMCALLAYAILQLGRVVDTWSSAQLAWAIALCVGVIVALLGWLLWRSFRWVWRRYEQLVNKVDAPPQEVREWLAYLAVRRRYLSELLGGYAQESQWP